METIKMVDRRDPSKVIEAVRFTEENGAEIAAYWDNLEYDAEEAMLYKKGDHVPWQPGRWVISQLGLKTAYFGDEEILLAAYEPVVELEEYDKNGLSPMQARLLLNSIYGKKMPDGSLGSIEYVEKIQRGEAELPQVDINDVVTEVSEDGYLMTGKVGPDTARRMGFASEEPEPDSAEIEALMRRELNQIKHAIIGDNGIGKIEVDRREWTNGLDPKGLPDGYFASADPVSGGTLAYYKTNEDGSISAAGFEEVDESDPLINFDEMKEAMKDVTFPIPGVTIPKPVPASEVLRQLGVSPADPVEFAIDSEEWKADIRMQTEKLAESLSKKYGIPVVHHKDLYKDTDYLLDAIGDVGMPQKFVSPAYICDLQELVCEFHEAFSHPAPKEPTQMPHERAILRTKMIQEELDEFNEASAKRDFVEQYDALLDILVLAYGGLVEMGVDATPGFVEVMRANMSKLGADGKPIISRGEELDGYPTGKILKGPGYAKPDLVKVLKALGWEPDKEEPPTYKEAGDRQVRALQYDAYPHHLYFGPES